ncbi:TVP38/TMEM64 family protein, partial [Mycobacterium sp. 1245805.9]|uniref:TVP38/TMEM64 family protein n=1 Tax=Mycobacterium sp. 1245805.9 TaxID=1856862 RepID=UPI0007FFDD73
MTASATCKITRRLRDVGRALGATARQLSGPRTVATVVGITVLIVVASWLPLPTPVQMRDWAESVGPWFPLAFFAAHIVVTVVPVPRTAFTLAAGLLFGPVLGVAIAVAASTASAVIAMLLVRAAGWQLNRLVRHRAIDTVDERLRERGWLAVLSLRLIPAVPFSAINYAAGASAVRPVPYTLATLAGLLPGTAAVVVLGDALARHPSPL